MRHYIDYTWYETPRMCWRVDGLPTYLFGFVVVYVGTMVFLGLFALAYIAIFHLHMWRPDTWTGWAIILSLPLPISLFTFAPGIVRIKDGRLIYSGGVDRERGWELKNCRVLSCTAVRGVLKLQIEVLLSNWKSNKTQYVRVLARPKNAQKIQAAFESGGATIAPGAEIANVR